MNHTQLTHLLALLTDADGESTRPDLVVTLPPVVFIRTVTMHYVGHVIDITADWIILDNASWVADSGRFGEALATGKLNETELFPNQVWVGRGAIVDVTAWNHPLPTSSQ